MSGVQNRIKNETNISSIGVKGFNGSMSKASKLGQNEDGYDELYVKDMPSDLVLLCANEYASEGAAILFSKDGIVLKLSKEEQVELREYIEQFVITKKLVVKNKTYEVSMKSENEEMKVMDHAANATATRYFNTKIHVSNVDEMILALLLSGITYKQLYELIKNDAMNSLPREITIKALNNFAHRQGTSPDVLQLARPNLARECKRLFCTKRGSEISW